MRVLIATAATPEAPASEYADAIQRAWNDWNPADSLTPLPFPHEGRGVLEALDALGFTRTGPATASRGTHHVIDASALLGAAQPSAVPSSAVPSGAKSSGVVPSGTESSGAAPSGVPHLGSTSALAPALQAALADGGQRISIAARPLPIHDGGRGLLETLTSRSGAVSTAAAASRVDDLSRPDALSRGSGIAEARSALAGVRLELVRGTALALLGLDGAGAALGAVVGAEEAQRLDRAVGEWAAGVERDNVRTDLVQGRPLRLSAAPGSGLAGGAGFALLVLGATGVDEAAWVAELAGLAEQVAECDLAVVAVPSLDGAAMDASVLTVVGEAALDSAIPVVVLTAQDQTSRRARAGLGIAGAYVTEGNTFAPADVGLLARRVAQTWSRPDSPDGHAAT